MKISKSIIENEITILEIEGEIDAHTTKTLAKALNDLFAQGHNRLVLDISKITFISSAGLRTILYAHREAVQLGGEVRLFGLNAQVCRTFETAGFYDLLHISDRLKDSIEGWL